MFKLFLKILSLILITLLFLIGGLLFWLKDGPKSSKYLTKIIEKQIARIYPDFTVKIDSTVISWDKKSSNIIFSVNNLKTTSVHTDDFVNLPNINVNIDLIELIKTNLFSTQIIIYNPLLSLSSKRQKENTQGEETTSKKDPLNKRIFKLPFKNIKITDAQITLVDKEEKYFYNVEKLSVNSVRNNSLEISSRINSNNIVGEININAINKNGIYEYKTNISNLEISLISYLMHNEYKDIKGNINFIASLKTNDKNIIAGEFEFFDINGKLTDKRDFAVHNIKGTISPKQINVEKLNIIVDNSRELSFKAEIDFEGLFARFLGINITTNINNFKIDDIKYFWPGFAVPNIRNWIVTNLTNGEIENASGNFKFNFSDARNFALPPESIQAKVKFNKANLNYYQDFPNLSNVSGEAEFSEKMVNINLYSGNIVSSEIKEAKVNIPFIYDSAITIQGKVAGEANDIVEFVPSQSITNAKEAHIDLTTIEGQALTEVDIKIPLNPNSSWDEYKFLIKSDLKDIILNNLPNNLSMSKGELEAVFDGEKVTVKGEALIGNSPSTIEWLGYVKENPPFDSKLLLNIKLLPKIIKLSDDIDFFDGKIDIHAKVVTKNKTKNISIDAIFDNASLNFKRIGFKKISGDDAKARIEATIKQDKLIRISDLNIEGKNISIVGKADLDQKNLSLVNLDLPTIKFNDNDLNINLTTKDNKNSLNVLGSNLNLSNAEFKQFSRSDNDNIKEQNITINIDKVKLKNNQEFSSLKANIKCFNNICNQADISALIGDNYDLDIKFTSLNKDSSEFKIKTGNAGAILKAFDINKNIKLGKLTIKGIQDINNNKAKFTGKIKVKDFIVAETPILSKLFTFTSLPKLVEIPFAVLPGENIAGNDIPFTNLIADFTLHNRNLIISDGTVEGPQLGLTVGGLVNMNKSEVNFSGTIIPELLGISKVINNIPLLGTIIQGGKNRGLVAASYTIKGPYNNIQTFVNPLSMLTPGFLRNIFSIFEINRSKQVDLD
ncbi:MAG: DUF3971 domain-containing protein [Alphaproteobacteria bacterium]